MSTFDLLGTAATARLLDVSRREVVRMVDRGVLQPATKLDGKTGAYLFDRIAVAALAAERAA